MASLVFSHAATDSQLASLMVGVVGSKSVVSRKTLQIVVLLCLVAFVLAYPVIESRDHWDPPGPSSDSELEFIGVLTFAGAIVLLTQLLTILSVSISPMRFRVCSTKHSGRTIFSVFRRT